MCGTSNLLYFNFLSKSSLMQHFPTAQYVYKKINNIPIEKESESLKAKSSLACYLSIAGAVGSIFKSSIVGTLIFGLSAILSYKTILETKKFERLEKAIISLNNLNHKLRREHKKFKENSDQMIENLRNNNKDFESQNQALKEEIEKLEELVKIARKTNDELFALQKKHGVTANLYQQIGKNLERVKDSFETHDLNLEKKIRELSTEINRLREIKA